MSATRGDRVNRDGVDRDGVDRDGVSGRRRTGRRLTTAALLVVVGLPAGLLVASPPAAAVDTEAATTVQAMLDANATGGTNGYYLREVGGPVHAASNEGVQFEPASTIKALIFAHAVRQVDDGNATLGEQVNNQWSAEPGGSCPDDGSAPASSSLQNGLTLMMQNSDNTWTQAVRERFGDPGPADPMNPGPINQTAAALGMSNSLLTHRIGCGNDGTDSQGTNFTGLANDPNRLTLEDAGVLYEQMANGYLDDWDNARTMIETGDGAFNTVIDSEAAGLGLSAQGISDFKAAQDSGRKAGSYGWAGLSYLSIAGWAEVPFKDSFCADDPRQFVHGVFVDQSSTGLGGLSIRAALAELMRERFRAALQSWANCEADLDLIDASFVDPPATIDVNTPTDLTVRHEFANNGPGSIADAVVEVDVTVPGDCTAQPANYLVQRAAVAGQPPEVVEETVTVTCSQPSNHPMSLDATISSALPDRIDPDPSNNAASDAIEPAVIAHADLAVTDVDASALDGAVLGDLLVGGQFDFAAPVTVHNHGDTVHGVYHDPSDGVVTREITVPAGLTGSVAVTGDEAPAAVQVQAEGQAPVFHLNQPAGTVHELSGPGTIRVTSFHDLVVDVPEVVAADFGLACEAPGTYDVTLAAEVAPGDPHVVDPDGGNDGVEHTTTVECATPIAINVRPGNDKNRVKVDSGQTLPVAALSTQSGEYGLPVAFDATTIDAATARFGAAATLADGDGSAPMPVQLLVHDSFEPDDSTKDGDADATVVVGVPGSGLTSGSTEACLTGTYSPDGINEFTFFGCDVVAPK